MSSTRRERPISNTDGHTDHGGEREAGEQAQDVSCACAAGCRRALSRQENASAMVTSSCMEDWAPGTGRAARRVSKMMPEHQERECGAAPPPTSAARGEVRSTPR